MKLFPRILLIIFLLLLCGCSEKEKVTVRELMDVEAMMDRQPDSALIALRAISPDSLFTPADSALYALLLTQAEYKNFLDNTDTTLITQAIRYYQTDHKDRRHLMLSLYYKGILLYNAKQYDDAIHPLFEAEKIAISLSDYLYLGLIYRTISSIFGCILNNSNELIYSYKSWQAFIKSGNESYAMYEISNYGSALNNNFMYDDAISLINDNLPAITASNDSINIAFAYKTLAVSFLGKCNYPEAIRFFKLAENFGTLFDSQEYQLLLKAYDNNGDYAKSDSIYQLLVDNAVPAVILPEQALCSRQDYKKAYESQKLYTKFTDSVFKVIVQQQVTKSLITYKELENQKILFEAKASRRRLFFIYALIISSLIFICLYIYISRKKKIKELKNDMSILHDVTNSLHRSLSASHAEYESFSRHTNLILKKSLRELDNLCSDYFAHPNKRSSYYKDLVNSTIEHLKSASDFTDCLLTDFDTVNRNIITDLKQSDANLTPLELQFLAYILFGFSYAAISLLLSKDNAVLYRLKYKLKSKIMNSNFPRQKEILTYIN